MRAFPVARTVLACVAAVLVACHSDPGDDGEPVSTGVRITVATEGSFPDADGYLLSLDGGPGQRIGVNGSVSLEDLAAGSHRIVIEDLAANCRVSGPQERRITLEAGQTANVDFSLICAAPAGTVRMEVVTTGPDSDGDGYLVTISGSQPARVLANALVEVAAEGGERSVAVTGLSPNCVASADNPASVVVLAGRVVTLRLKFTCAAITGAVQVVVISTGGAMDPNGYQLQGEWLATPFEIGVNGSVAFSQVLAGSRAVTLSGVQANCEVEGGATHAVTVIAADTVEVHFAIRCTVFARLTVSTNTRPEGSWIPGVDRLPGGFRVRVAYDNSTFTASVLSNGSVTLELPFAGEYRVSLDPTPNCYSSVQTVVIDTDDAAVTFSVACRTRRLQP